MIEEPLSFIGAGGARLSGVVRRPAGDVRGAVLMAHCFTCSKDLHTTTRLARALATGGFVTLAFDFTGLGDSEGDFASTTVSTDVSDIVRAAVAMIERGYGPCVLLGHSLGGAAAVLAASRLHTVDAVVCVASPSDVDHIRHLFPPDAGSDGRAFTVSIGGRPFLIGAEFLADLETHDVRRAAASLEVPILVVEAGADTVVGPEQTRALAEAAGADLETVPGADHLFSNRSHADRLGQIVVDWVRNATAR